jgi:uncharacterized protein (TIGR03083 family)
VPTLAPSPRCHVVSGATALDLLDREIQRIAQLATQTDPSAPVPGCPGWDLADLLVHLGKQHRRTEKLVSTLSPVAIDPRSLEIRPPEGQAARAAWFADGGERLVATLRAADPDAPIYSWAGDRHVRFWIRRMLHETTVHRTDVEAAADVTGYLDPGVATDMIDEFLEILPSAGMIRPHIRDLQGDGETLHLHATDLTGAEDRGEWLITLEPDGFRWSHAHVKGAAAVRGTVADLAMFVYGRRSDADPGLEVLGDRSLLVYWSAKSRF